MDKFILHKIFACVYGFAPLGGPLHLGDIETLPDLSLCVKCPWHSWCFDLHTGRVRRPAGRNLEAAVYSTKVLPDGTILVGFDQFDPHYFTAEDF